MQLFAVSNSEGDYVSAWRDYANAYAAAGECQAMDPESCYSVDIIDEEELSDFWFNNPHLTVA